MTELHSLKGSHAVVTGGGTGIGAAIAAALAKAGARVTLMGRNLGRLQKMAETLAEAQAISVDVSLEDSVEAAFAAAVAGFGPVDILVNNAGVAEAVPFTRVDMAQWQQTLAVNLTGTYLCTKAVIGGMLAAKHGRIVNIASTAGLTGYAYTSAYCAAKHGVIGLTRSLALEVAKKGITVNAVCPGYTETDIIKNAIDNIVAKTGRTAEQARADLTVSNPQGRMVQPSEVANTVLWLCGPGAGAMNGQSIAVAGGEVM